MPSFSLIRPGKQFIRDFEKIAVSFSLDELDGLPGAGIDADSAAHAKIPVDFRALIDVLPDLDCFEGAGGAAGIAGNLLKTLNDGERPFPDLFRIAGFHFLKHHIPPFS
jgi:hypothetical protein